MRKFIAGIALGVCLTGSVATAAGLDNWRAFRNEEVTCSIGKSGTGLGAVCVAIGGKWANWSVLIDKDAGLQVTNGHSQVMFTRGPIGK